MQRSCTNSKSALLIGFGASGLQAFTHVIGGRSFQSLRN
jgi:hypothetical protein